MQLLRKQSMFLLRLRIHHTLLPVRMQRARRRSVARARARRAAVSAVRSLRRLRSRALGNVH